jgi:hypothetical protein
MEVSFIGGGNSEYQEKIADLSQVTEHTVIHHQVGRGPHVPSMTPFALKLETYLRMASIPYLVCK